MAEKGKLLSKKQSATGKRKLLPQTKKLFVIYGLTLTVFLLMVIISPTYRSAENIGNIIVQCVPLAIVSLGQTVVMIGGGIDMSVGSLISLSTCIAAVAMKSGTVLSLILAIVLVFAAALLTGLCNGLGVNYAKVPPLIATLSMMTLLSGVAQGVLPVVGGCVNVGFAKLLMARHGILSMSIVILFAAYLAVRHLLYRTATGVAIYAIGNNRVVAASMGVKARRVNVLTYVIASVCAAVTGLMLASKMRVGDPLVGTSFGLDSITAAAIGGTALTGGVGLVAGSIAGAFLIGMLSNMMNILGVNHFYQYVLKGLLLGVAMVIYSLSSILGVKKRGKA